MSGHGPPPIRDSDYPSEELFELTENGTLHNSPIVSGTVPKYVDRTSIDWLQEEAAERERSHARRSERGVRGMLLPWMDAARMWFVVITTGIGIGIAGAWLDVLVKWCV